MTDQTEQESVDPLTEQEIRDAFRCWTPLTPDEAAEMEYIQNYGKDPARVREIVVSRSRPRAPASPHWKDDPTVRARRERLANVFGDLIGIIRNDPKHPPLYILPEDFDPLCDAVAQAVEARRAPASPEGTCLWKPDDDGIYHTACGNAWFFDTGDVKENRAKFCPYCGKLIADPAGPPRAEGAPYCERTIRGAGGSEWTDVVRNGGAARVGYTVVGIGEDGVVVGVRPLFTAPQLLQPECRTEPDPLPVTGTATVKSAPPRAEASPALTRQQIIDDLVVWFRSEFAKRAACLHYDGTRYQWAKASSPQPEEGNR